MESGIAAHSQDKCLIFTSRSLNKQGNSHSRSPKRWVNRSPSLTRVPCRAAQTRAQNFLSLFDTMESRQYLFKITHFYGPARPEGPRCPSEAIVCFSSFKDFYERKTSKSCTVPHCSCDLKSSAPLSFILTHVNRLRIWELHIAAVAESGFGDGS